MSVTFYVEGGEKYNTPEVNLSNSNAMVLIRLLRLNEYLEEEYLLWGSVPSKHHHLVIEQCDRFTADPAQMMDSRRQTIVTRHADGSVRMIDFGIDLLYLERRVADLRNVFSAALTLDRDILWG